MGIRLLLLTIFILALPALGAALAGQPLDLYFEFPPVSHFHPSTSFSWLGFAIMAALFLGLATLLAMLAFGPKRVAGADARPSSRFPLWGWAGGLLIGAGLVNPLEHLAPTLWSLPIALLLLGYILLVNSLTCRRTYRCLLRDRPGFFLALFPASGVMWWYLEYLNRYVRNWHFMGMDQSTSLDYLLQCTLAFSPLVPAVVATRQLLATFPSLMSRLHTGRPIARHHVEPTALLLLTLAVLGLMGAGAWPHIFFPLLWLSPVFLITAFQLLAGETTLFTGVRRGDWSRVVLPAFAALPVAVLLQLANGGTTRWVYDLPLLQRFEVQGLPLIGYAAFLPFGILCLQVADMVGRGWRGRKRPPFPVEIRVESPRR